MYSNSTKTRRNVFRTISNLITSPVSVPHFPHTHRRRERIPYRCSLRWLDGTALSHISCCLSSYEFAAGDMQWRPGMYGIVVLQWNTIQLSTDSAVLAAFQIHGSGARTQQHCAVRKSFQPHCAQWWTLPTHEQQMLSVIDLITLLLLFLSLLFIMNHSNRLANGSILRLYDAMRAVLQEHIHCGWL